MWPQSVACSAPIVLAPNHRKAPWQLAGCAARQQATWLGAGVGGAQMRAAAPLTFPSGAAVAPGQVGGRSLALAQLPSRPTTSSRPQARLAPAACVYRDQQHGQQPPARWQQADEPKAPAVDRALSGLCRRRQQQRWRQQHAGQARRLQTAICSLPTVAASGGTGDPGEADGEQALHPNALTGL